MKIISFTEIMIVISEQYMHNSTVYCSNVLTEDVAAVQRTEDAVVFFPSTMLIFGWTQRAVSRCVPLSPPRGYQ